MADTNITKEHQRAFEALTSGAFDSFALFSCFCIGYRRHLLPSSLSVYCQMMRKAVSAHGRGEH